MRAVSPSELQELLQNGAVVVLDVRPREEFKAGHIAQARSIPVADLEKRLKELPKRREIVAYCRGPYCVYADEAVDLLCAKGYNAARLVGGYPDWKAAGRPVEGE
jgi:rhodanese-related sulfurtransferase